MASLVVLCTCPTDAADAIAGGLVKDKLAACVNTIKGISSVYRWHGNLETASESLLLIKAASQDYDKLEQRLRALHPYELPEIIALPIDRGYAPYLDWLETRGDNPPP